MELSKSTYRICCGYTRCFVADKTYIVHAPTYDILYLAEEAYEKALDNQRFSSSLHKPDAVRFLVSQGIWYVDGEKQLTKVEKDIEDVKVNMYRSYRMETKYKSLLKDLGKLNRLQQNLLERKHKYDHTTKEGFADYVKSNFILLNCIYGLDGNRVWNNMDECNPSLLNQISVEFKSNQLSHDELRLLARSEPWKTIWRVEGMKVFKNTYLDDEQRSLVLYSQMYDSIYAHPECPPDVVIKNDDLLDGWLISNRREAEKNRADKDKDSNVPENLKNHKEVFLMARNQKEAQEIFELNDAESREVVKGRQAMAKKHGEVKLSQMPDVQMELRNQLQQQLLAKGK
jgi:hypothetical protein